MRRPPAITVQAPHWPWSQPFLVPVKCRWSRSASSNVVRVSSSSACGLPLISKVTFEMTGAAVPEDSAASALKGSALAAAAAAASCNNSRRFSSSSMSCIWFAPAGRIARP